MVTYHGMSLSSEIRESISLDDDDLSDVEDEVFIRDGKNRYRYAEDIGLKRPLMAPRRKISRPDFKSRLRNRPPCRPLCKPCCYLCGGLLGIIGVIILVVIIVSIFPLPIDKMKNWIVAKMPQEKNFVILPCSELKTTKVWAVSLPKLTTETSIRAVDVNADGVEDAIFGFGAGDSSILTDEIFCPIFMGVASPCEGGIIALDGRDGRILWKRHLAKAVFSLFCSSDLNLDKINDCLVTGKGMLALINGRNGSIIWQFEDPWSKNKEVLIDILTANFIKDIDNDTVDDVLATHTFRGSVDGTNGAFLLLLSGKTGRELNRIPTLNNTETYYIPQLLEHPNGESSILLGTGSPMSAGNLTLLPLKSLLNNSADFKTIFEHKSSGVVTPSILVDLNGDNQLDIVSALFNSTIVALDGSSYKVLWTVFVNSSESLSLPTPGYFNDDNVTDFLVKYQFGPGFPIYYYSQTFIIDGKTGGIFNASFVTDTVGSQMGSLTLSMEGRGFDFFTYWSADCLGFDGNKSRFKFLSDASLNEQISADLCKGRFNSSKVARLYAMNQFDQPPGIELYSSLANVNLEYNNSRSALEEAEEYLRKNPEVQVVQSTNDNLDNFGKIKAGSPFRHKADGKGLIKDFKNKHENRTPMNQAEKFSDYDQVVDTWPQNANSYPAEMLNQPDIDYSNYDIDGSPLFGASDKSRDTRDEELNVNGNNVKKDLGKNGIYDYLNIKQSRNRLLHDLNSSPTEILRDNYYKNLERRLRKSRFEERDLKSHKDKTKDNEEVQKVIEEEKKKALNVSVNLWDLESEKEIEERNNGYNRGKRDISAIQGVPQITSIGTLVKSLNSTGNSIDFIFATYWVPSKFERPVLTEEDFQCIANKVKTIINSKEQISNVENVNVEERFANDCLNERKAFVKKPEPIYSEAKFNFPYMQQIAHLGLGQMTVYRMRIECVRCAIKRKDERCAKFLDPSHGWSAYLNQKGDGVYRRP